MAINLTKKVAPKVLDVFHHASVTEGIFSSDYSFTGAKTVQVHTIDDLPLNNYTRPNNLSTDYTNLNRFGTLTEVGDTYQEMEMTQELAQNGSIDKANDTDRAIEVAAAKVIRQNLQNVIVPAMDKYRLQKLATGYSGWGTTKGTAADTWKNSLTNSTKAALSKSNIVEAILSANSAMSDVMVPTAGRVLFMSYAEALKLKLADQVIGIDKLGEQAIVNGVMGKVDQCQIRLVPSSWMPADVGFLIVAKGCACAPVKLSTARVLKDNPNIDGANIQTHYYHDCFVFDAKANGIYVYKTA